MDALCLLSYEGVRDVVYLVLERVKGIEPSQSAWEADVLPLNYTRKYVVLRAFYPRKKLYHRPIRLSISKLVRLIYV